MVKSSDRISIDRLEQEIKRKEMLARTAKNRGMLTTFGNYKTDIAVLKSRLEKLRTAPGRVL